MELPFTLENKRRNTSFKSTILDPQKSAFLVFVETENPKKKKISSCFGLDSALKTIDAQMFFWLVFLKMHKKVIDRQKRYFGRFLLFIKFFVCVFKAESKPKHKENIF